MEKIEILNNLENKLRNVEKEYNSIYIGDLKISNDNIEKIELEKNKILEELNLLEDEMKKANIFTKISLKLKIIDKKSKLKILDLSLKEEKDKFLSENKEIVKEYNQKLKKRENLQKEINKIKDKINKVKSKKFLCAKDFIFVEGGKYEKGEVFDIEVCKYPTTQKMWLEVMKINPSAFKGYNRPVEQVSWWDALKFCNKLSEKYGLEPVYDLSESSEEILSIRELDGKIVNPERVNFKNTEGFRLPTELEWEWFARGGQKAIDEGTFNTYIYSGSNNFDEVAWCAENTGVRDEGCCVKGGSTQDVGLKKPNQLGLYDCSGNVWEWCYNASEDIEKEKLYVKPLDSFKYKRTRGGCWRGDGVYCSVFTSYHSALATEAYYVRGFRVVRTV
ncbi:SUMF1/EgtB/PvdO family nonheme iron enzyme [Fusobacterium simiae]|uniref:SUMF1/EgtB/PvdO family nonheme iron enzyme n=1 Tax=Fusobacterium simiae TaxID=855 RepID=A0ABT4DKN7_FUSSI|nr:SUMF1/EgtB/PvdO family nonheme iron enzyme [Fusobacterium simiae]MCY7009175.1 SUMF1/EgtB/PvdO family nonheme iron enzyme [Fusobacterium simiae]